ncbi:ERVV2 protein, partial [Furnarius figulus]|nr:ERVV2 protein [Furnarius figulus]
MTFHSMIRPLIPSSGLIELEKAIINISVVIEHIKNHTLDAIMALQEEVRGLARVVLQNRMVLNFLLASQEGMCTIINSSCCSYIDQNGRISRDLD